MSAMAQKHAELTDLQYAVNIAQADYLEALGAYPLGTRTPEQQQKMDALDAAMRSARRDLNEASIGLHWNQI